MELSSVPDSCLAGGSTNDNNNNHNPIHLSYQGKTIIVDNVSSSVDITGYDLHKIVFNAIQLSSTEYTLKLLYKGKRIDNTADVNITSLLFGNGKNSKTTVPKILVMASSSTIVQELNSKRQDPTIRGFDQEKKKKVTTDPVWGPTVLEPSPFVSSNVTNRKDYKFVRVRECTEHEFGHRCNDTVPHSFVARTLLQKLATDPGVLSILQSHQLVVNTLGEMDPIDDRLMRKHQSQQHGSCLLGYNTNHGLRIDIKLRTDNLQSFRPYFELVSTLIHELSHNWINEHDTLFWINYGCMRIEYFLVHKYLQPILYNGKTSSSIANIPASIIINDNDTIFNYIVQKELVTEMAQHQLHPQMIVQPLREKYNELISKLPKLSSRTTAKLTATTTQQQQQQQQQNLDKRTLAFQAAEQRRNSSNNNTNISSTNENHRQQQQQLDKNDTTKKMDKET